MKSENNIFKRVDKETDRKLRYEGFCFNCNKNTPHRYGGSTSRADYFICMKCKTHNLGTHEANNL